MAVNYGLDRVRFPHAVRAGSRVRNRAVLKKIEKRGFRRVLVTVENTIEIEGLDKPAMVADVLGLIYL
jgi:acyl dehydratase